MSRNLQPETHPDAEQLSAFAEQALPAGERAGVLAHLAKCDRCRQVLFLSQAPVEAPVRRHARKPAPEPRRRWFAAWRWAWVPAAAMAGVVLVLVLYPWHAKAPSPATQEARLNPPAPLGAPANPAPAPASAGRGVAVRPAHVLNKPAPSAAAAQAEPIPGQAAPAKQLAENTAPVPSPPVATGLTVSSAAVETAPEASAEGGEHARTAVKAASVAAGGRMAMAPAVHRSAAMPPNGYAVADKSAGAFPAAAFRLPKGETAAAVARGPILWLALAPSGALYRSADAGARWEPVEAAWSGRAVRLRAGESGFELWTDAGARWTSADGLTWLAR